MMGNITFTSPVAALSHPSDSLHEISYAPVVGLVFLLEHVRQFLNAFPVLLVITVLFPSTRKFTLASL